MKKGKQGFKVLTKAETKEVKGGSWLSSMLSSFFGNGNVGIGIGIGIGIGGGNGNGNGPGNGGCPPPEPN